MNSADQERASDESTTRAQLVREELESAIDSESEHDHRPRVNLSSLEVQERMERGEMIENARISGFAFKGTYAHPVKFHNVTLIRPVMDRVEFQAEVVFEHCILDRPKIGKKTTFAMGLDLRGSKLSHPLFRNLVIHDQMRLDRVEIRGQTLFANCTFEGRVRFWETRFNGWATFERCVFKRDADFRSLHAEEGFVLESCEFESDALFRGATCTKKWEASKTKFNGLLDLSKAKLHDFVYLETIIQGEKQRFSFHNALAERLLIRTDQLVGRIDSEEKQDYSRAMEEYGLLKRAFEGLHRYDQEDWAFYCFKVNQRRAAKRSWNRPLSKLAQFLDWLLLDRGCGYGTNPLRAVRAAVLIMLAFALVYITCAADLYIEKLPFPEYDINYWPNRLIVGSLTSVSVFTSGFGSLRDTARGWVNLPLILESLLGTFLWGLFIVAFSRKVIR